MATSPNYGWLEPDNTDLVKNGALAIRTLGNAIDTTMATMTPKSIVDAKGDLIAASAADTPARLAVGNNGETLVADSSTATGLDWKSATEQYPWQAWTPTYTNISVGNGTVTARYAQIGKTVICEYNLIFGSTTTISSPARITTPVNSKMAGDSFRGNYLDSGTAGYEAWIGLPAANLFELAVPLATGTYVGATGVSATVPFTWTTNDTIWFRATYEAA